MGVDIGSLLAKKLAEKGKKAQFPNSVSKRKNVGEKEKGSRHCWQASLVRVAQKNTKGGLRRQHKKDETPWGAKGFVNA